MTKPEHNSYNQSYSIFAQNDEFVLGLKNVAFEILGEKNCICFDTYVMN